MAQFNEMDRVKLKRPRGLSLSDIIGLGWNGSPAYLAANTVGVVLDLGRDPDTLMLQYKVEFPINDNCHALLACHESELDLVQRGVAGTW